MNKHFPLVAIIFSQILSLINELWLLVYDVSAALESRVLRLLNNLVDCKT